MLARTIVATCSFAATVVAQTTAQHFLGFNSGNMLPNQTAKVKADWLQEFETAKVLQGAPGNFTAVRLYTNIQGYTEDDPIQAFEAAIETGTNILLGVWASHTDNIEKEMFALEKALDLYGQDLVDLIIGVSIGSEDMYRVSEVGIANDPNGVGNPAEVIVGFIDDFRTKFNGTAIADVPVGHVDTFDAWYNSSNSAVLEAVDWIGMNVFPYFFTDRNNTIENGPEFFDQSYEVVKSVAGDTPIWITETGWPSSGPDWDLAETGIENAKYYWDEVGCRRLFANTTTFWYILRDSNPANSMQFTITDNLEAPLFNLTCPTTFETDQEGNWIPPDFTLGVSQPSATGGTADEDSAGSSSEALPVTQATVAAIVASLALL
ncbi:glycoside hydrolase superfamily [Plectosphaerella cucumerina]|uniref:Glycoside hydrolase superfamily n=1 Tax=Plectosphaerella cucumerina TaxID=40658 RepID=A0A8K0X820_9PEZI|nr:glycoside hydrolase superfamily [Plectosphaerella cucumerina]